MSKLAAFSRERLAGHPIPDDLRILLTASWEGRSTPAEDLGFTFLEPEQEHPLLDFDYLKPEERADPEMRATMAATEKMTQYFGAVAVHEDRDVYGYWLHEPTADGLSLVMYDTEGQFGLTTACSFSEEIVASRTDEDEFDEWLAEFDQLQVPFRPRTRDELEDRRLADYRANLGKASATSPADMFQQFVGAEKARLGLS